MKKVITFNNKKFYQCSCIRGPKVMSTSYENKSKTTYLCKVFSVENGIRESAFFETVKLESGEKITYLHYRGEVYKLFNKNTKTEYYMNRNGDVVSKPANYPNLKIVFQTNKKRFPSKKKVWCENEQY